MVQNHLAGSTQIPVALGGPHIRRAQVQPAAFLWATDLDIIRTRDDLSRWDFRPQAPQVRCCGRRFDTPGLHHPLPIAPRHAFRWLWLGLSQRGFDGVVQFHRPGRRATGLMHRSQLGLQPAQIGLLEQPFHLGLFCNSNGLSMRTHPTPDLRLRHGLGVMRHPAQQSLGGAKGQVLRQQAHPLLHAPRGDPGRVWWAVPSCW